MNIKLGGKCVGSVPNLSGIHTLYDGTSVEVDLSGIKPDEGSYVVRLKSVLFGEVSIELDPTSRKGNSQSDKTGALVKVNFQGGFEKEVNPSPAQRPTSSYFYPVRF